MRGDEEVIIALTILEYLSALSAGLKIARSPAATQSNRIVKEPQCRQGWPKTGFSVLLASFCETVFESWVGVNAVAASVECFTA